MTPNEKRPVHLNLLVIHFPVAAVMSIGHRISGVFWIVAIPAVVYLIDLSLSGPDGFAQVRALFGSPVVKVAVFLLLWALVHHLLAGVRYLALDLDLGVEQPAARTTAWVVMLGAPVIASGLALGMLP